jgi:aspartyl-tRNA synthetase
MIKGLQTRCTREIAVFQVDNPKAGDFRLPADGKVVRLNYMDGVKILKEAGEDVTKLESFETDFSTAQEQHLGKLMRDKYDTDFYVLDKFPMAVRPFYTMPCPNDPNFSNSYDFFMRGEEIMSGAQRIHEPELLIQQMKKKDPPLDPEADGFKDYVDAFRYGCPPHAGGGLGLNRIVQFFLGLKDVREATFFPRDPGRLAP